MFIIFAAVKFLHELSHDEEIKVDTNWIFC